MEKNKYSKIYVVCPPNVKTGGTELLHQLVFQLNTLGAKAYIVYYDTIKRNIVLPEFNEYCNSSLILEDIVDDFTNLVIVPEVNVKILLDFKYIKRAIWWLSVDNYLNFQAGIYGKIKTKGVIRGIASSAKSILKSTYSDCRKLIYSADLHFCQSFYSIDYLKSLNITENVFYLSDYINDIYLQNSEKIDVNSKENIVLYNPKKGYKFTQKIISSSSNIKWVPLENMTTEEVQQTLKNAKLYIDFGNHPGKDRFPREAASCKCCVITGKKGAANYKEDVMIPDKYKFDEDVTDIGKILNCITYILDNYEKCIKDYEPYVKYILNEKSQFILDVQKLFFEQ